MPTEEELFKVKNLACSVVTRQSAVLTFSAQRYNPELQKRSLETREARQQEFDDYVNKLKEWSKSDKQIWFAAEEMRQKAKAEQKDKAIAEQKRLATEVEQRRREMKESTVR
ncbi:MAG: assembly factor cbp4 [Bathelium mastoideum]|nr:MAG: assembly factor cbp4 [Bathelium mastoideum]KAI9693372.1 MAG: assembly factor cbp4 [Bathelium mastoideum]